MNTDLNSLVMSFDVDARAPWEDGVRQSRIIRRMMPTEDIVRDIENSCKMKVCPGSVMRVGMMVGDDRQHYPCDEVEYETSRILTHIWYVRTALLCLLNRSGSVMHRYPRVRNLYNEVLHDTVDGQIVSRIGWGDGCCFNHPPVWVGVTRNWVYTITDSSIDKVVSRKSVVRGDDVYLQVGKPCTGMTDYLPIWLREYSMLVNNSAEWKVFEDMLHKQ